ncbi:MAG TPA: hypothetical protein VFU50_04805 [Terriglobales bacterium]|nr:hypothetical protein [Terriglobales bacterium]
MESGTQVALASPSGGAPVCGVRSAGRLLKHEISTHLMRSHEVHEISRQISDSLAMGYLTGSEGISDEIGWDSMGSDEITQMFELTTQQFSYRGHGVNATRGWR